MEQKFEGLRAKRQSMGLTIEQLAARVGLSSSMVRQVEVGAQRGSLGTRVKIANALNLPLRYLVSYSEAEGLMGLARPGRGFRRK